VRVLVTGHRGNIGSCTVELLERCGYVLVGFDLAEGGDLLDLPAVNEAAAGCEAIVHLGAIPHDTAGSPEQIMAVNVLGSWRVLLAAEAAEVTRVIHSVSLRPVAVWGPEVYARIEEQRAAEPRSEWEPFWEYGAFVDVRDVALAVERSLAVPLAGHHRALLCAADISGSAPSLELAARLAPGVPVRGPERYVVEPWRALVDCSAAEAVLGWRPRHRWSDRPATAA
jgi:nucleoside-diphosphate-sugar epimerase